MRKFVAVSLVLVIAVAVAAADEFVGFITKFEDGKMSVKKAKGTEPPEEITLKVADNVKIVRGKVNNATMKIEAGEAFEGGKDAHDKKNTVVTYFGGENLGVFKTNLRSDNS